MSTYDSDSELNHFDDWLDENSWSNLGNDFYECPGGHLYHEDEVLKLYNEAKSTEEKELPKDFMSKLTFEEGENQ
tara:strand:+ start:2462 stop:2686 length:225 start_codon:yes stop_codon:yes gene_type:complete